MIFHIDSRDLWQACWWRMYGLHTKSTVLDSV